MFENVDALNRHNRTEVRRRTALTARRRLAVGQGTSVKNRSFSERLASTVRLLRLMTVDVTEARLWRGAGSNYASGLTFLPAQISDMLLVFDAAVCY